MNTSCKVCLKQFKYPWMLRRHLERKNPCQPPVNSEISEKYSDLIEEDINLLLLENTLIKNEFGNNFNAHFDESNLNKWSGPYPSSFGYHIIFINDFTSPT